MEPACPSKPLQTAQFQATSKSRSSSVPLKPDAFSVDYIINSITPVFAPMPKPGLDDWLSEHNEKGQSLDSYKKGNFNKKTKSRHTIYIQPLEKSIDEKLLTTLVRFTEVFYLGLDVKLRTALDVDKLGYVGSRMNSGNKQYHAGNLLKFLENRLPEDAYCLIGVMMTDLYPRDSWNYVFGLASLKNRTGVFSFARYDENFFLDKPVKTINTDMIRYRACKVMVHEIGHMFGLKHCIDFHCLMNGSNHLEEATKKPMEMCPVCVGKLQHNMKFDLRERYAGLDKFCRNEGGEFAKNGVIYSRCLEVFEDSLNSK